MRGVPSRPPDPTDARAANQRARILGGLAIALGEKGYAATTIADIAAAARVSRTTVYAEFADKDQALIALYSDLSDRMQAEIGAALAGLPDAMPWREKAAALADAYLSAISLVTPGERLSLLEIASAGPRARQARRDILGRFADTVDRVSVVLATAEPEAQRLGDGLAVAVVGGVNELVLHAADDGPDAIRALGPAVTTLLVRLMAAVPADPEAEPAAPPRRSR